jgi:hypothetical protein
MLVHEPEIILALEPFEGMIENSINGQAGYEISFYRQAYLNLRIKPGNGSGETRCQLTPS